MTPLEGKDSESRRGTYAVLAIGTITGCVMIANIADYYFAKIPAMKVEIRNRESELHAVKLRAEPVDKVIIEIESLKQQWAILDSLQRTHIPLNRVLDRLCNAVVAQDGVWLHWLSIHVDNKPPPPGAAPGAKRFVMNLSGAVLKTTTTETQTKLANLLQLLEKEFEVGKVFSQKLNASFERPKLVEMEAGDQTREFALQISFEVAPPKPINLGEPLKETEKEENTPYTLDTSKRRDPFSAK